jgi:hypothetical protein
MKVELFTLIEDIAQHSRAHVSVRMWNDIKGRLKKKFAAIDRWDEKRAAKELLRKEERNK